MFRSNKRFHARRQKRIALILLCLVAPAAFGEESSLICAEPAVVPSVLRAEGITELVPDVVLTCSSAGVPGALSIVQVGLRMNTHITSREIGLNQSEALLIISDSTGDHMYLGAPSLTSTSAISSITWDGVSYVSAGPSATVTIRITNIRVNAAMLAASTSAPAVAHAIGTLTGLGPATTQPFVVASIQPSTATHLSNCAGGTLHQPVTPGTMHYSIVFSELFATAFRKQQEDSQRAGPGGSVFNTESGFMRNPPLLPPHVGLAHTGTRLIARFTSLPSGARVYVTTVPTGGSSPNISANLMPADSIGAIPQSGSTTPIAPTTSLTCPDAGGPVPATEIPVVNGSADAVWEITGARDTSAEVAVFGLTVEAPGTTRYLPDLGAALAPNFRSLESFLSETVPVPRFTPSWTWHHKPDLIWQHDITGHVTVWHMGSPLGNSVVSWTSIAADNYWNIVAAIDFGGSPANVRDLLWQNKLNATSTVWFMGGPDRNIRTSWAWIEGGRDLLGWTIVGSANFNADGQADLVLQNDSTRQATVWYLGYGWMFKGGPPTRLGSNWLQSTELPGWKIVAVADFNNDGKPDLLWQHDASRAVTLWYLTGVQGATVLDWTWVTMGVPGWTVRGASDFDGDLTPDIVWQNDMTRQATVWYMGANGAAVRSWSWLSSSPAPGWRIAAVY